MDDATKCCSICREEKPLNVFRRRRRGQETRHTECSACRSVADRGRRANLRDQRNRDALAAWATGMRRFRDSSPTMERICQLAVMRMGGIERFAAFLIHEMERSAKAGDHATSARLAIALFQGLQAMSGSPGRVRIRKVVRRRGE